VNLRFQLVSSIVSKQHAKLGHIDRSRTTWLFFSQTAACRATCERVAAVRRPREGQCDKQLAICGLKLKSLLEPLDCFLEVASAVRGTA